MSVLTIPVPHEVSRVLSRVEVPGVPEQLSEFHITLVYFGSNIPIDTISKAIVVAYEVASRTRPFSLSVDKVTNFPKGDDGYPIITQVASTELHNLWKDLNKGLDQAGIGYSKKYTTFKPHVTLSYAEDPIEPIAVGPFEWAAYEMVLWGGDSGDDKIFITLPFSMPGKEALYRKLVQARVRFPGLL